MHGIEKFKRSAEEVRDNILTWITSELTHICTKYDLYYFSESCFYSVIIETTHTCEGTTYPIVVDFSADLDDNEVTDFLTNRDQMRWNISHFPLAVEERKRICAAYKELWELNQQIHYINRDVSTDEELQITGCFSLWLPDTEIGTKKSIPQTQYDVNYTRYGVRYQAMLRHLIKHHLYKMTSPEKSIAIVMAVMENWPTPYHGDIEWFITRNTPVQYPETTVTVNYFHEVISISVCNMTWVVRFKFYRKLATIVLNF